MTWCHHYQITLKARQIPECLNVMADLLSRSNQVQSTEWSLHPQVFKLICQKWFTHHVNLFATCLNQKVPLYISPVPDHNAWNIDALNINWVGYHCLCLPSHSAPSQGDPKNQAIQLSDHCNSPRLARDALVLGPRAALNRDLTSTSSVKNSNSPTTMSFTAIHNISTSMPGVQEWTAPRTRLLCGGSRENCCPSKVINKDHPQVKVGPI